jgi:kynurenine formamidase
MLMQYVAGMDIDLPHHLTDKRDTPGPEALILSAGIYNIPLFLRNHSSPADIASIYASIISGAFGAESGVYQGVSPVAGKYNRGTWKEGKLIILAHSYDDELVERAQRDVMCVALDRQGWSIVMEDDDEEGRGDGKRVLEVRDIQGTHDFVWEDGVECAKLIAEVVARLG